MTHQPPPNSIDMKFPAKRLKLIPSKHSKTNSPDEIQSTHRQDLGKVS